MTQRALGHFRPGHIGQSVNYVDTHHAYANETDIPLKAKHAKQQVLHFLDPDSLDTKKKPWNNLTTPGGPFPDHRGPMHYGMPFAPRFPDPSKKRSLHIGTSTRAEIDRRAERVPKRDPVAPTKTSKLQFDPRRLLGDSVPANLGGTGPAQPRMDTTVPPGKQGHPTTRFVVDIEASGKLDLVEAWNGSTEQDVVSKRTRHNQMLELALENSKRKARQLTAKRISLRETYKTNRDKTREQKKIEALKEGDMEVYLSKIATLKSDDPEGLQAEEERRRQLDRTELVYSKDWKAKEYVCDGVWAYDEREGRHRWSCCGSFLQDSPGCQPKKKLGYGWNFASIN